MICETNHVEICITKYIRALNIFPESKDIRNYPYRVLCSVAGRDGEIVTDQIRTPWIKVGSKGKLVIWTLAR